MLLTEISDGTNFSSDLLLCVFPHAVQEVNNEVQRTFPDLHGRVRPSANTFYASSPYW